jgi:hypothetical protein
MTSKISNGVRNFLSKIWWGIISMGLPMSVFADTGGCNPEGGGLTNPLKSCTFAGLVENIAKLAAQIGIPIAAIFIIYSGILFVTARGSEDKLNKAKTNFWWAIIGTAILLGAWVIAGAISTTIKGLE